MNDTPSMSPIHPGEVLLQEYLEPFGVTQHKLAVAIGVPPRWINEIVHGKRRISADRHGTSPSSVLRHHRTVLAQSPS